MTGAQDIQNTPLYNFMFITDADKIADSGTKLPELDTHDETQGTFIVADWLMDLVRWFLGLFHAEHNGTLFTFVYAVLVFLLSWGVGYILKWIIWA